MTLRGLAAAAAVAVAAFSGSASAYVLAVNPSQFTAVLVPQITVLIEDTNGGNAVISGTLAAGVGFMTFGVSVFGTIKVKRGEDSANWRTCMRNGQTLVVPDTAQRVTIEVSYETNNENRQDPYHIRGCIGQYE